MTNNFAVDIVIAVTSLVWCCFWLWVWWMLFWIVRWTYLDKKQARQARRDAELEEHRTALAAFMDSRPTFAPGPPSATPVRRTKSVPMNR